MSSDLSGRPARLAIVGSTSPAGKQLRELADGDPGSWKLELLDTDEYAGLLQEFGGEIEIVQVISPDRLSDVDAAVFTCAPSFLDDYVSSGAYLPPVTVDATGGGRSGPVFIARHPAGEEIRAAPGRILIAAGAETTVLARLLAPLADWAGVERCHATVVGSAADRGAPFMDRLQEETIEILNFQQAAERSQRLAFNVWGPGADGAARGEHIARQVGRLTPPSCPAPAVQVSTAPVFQGTSFSIYVHLGREVSPGEVLERLVAEPDVFGNAPGATPLDALGSDRALVSAVTDGAEPGSFWLWIAADGSRITAVNALELVRRASIVGV